MGSNATQAKGLILFGVAFVVFAAGLAAGGNLPLLIAALVPLAISLRTLARCKRLEQPEE